MELKKPIILAVILVLVFLILFFLVRFARAGEVIDPADLAWLNSALIAHRGLHDGNKTIPENSMPAFRAAVEKGYIIELDVAMTKDKQLVVYHDKKLRRGLGIDGYLHELTYEELAQYKIFGSAETIPLFRHVLTLVDGKVPLVVEVKNEGAVGEMESLLYEELKDYHGEYAVQAFNPFTLNWFRKNAPEVIRGQLAGSFVVSDYEVEYAGTTRVPGYQKFLLENLLLNFLSRPHFIAYETNHATNARLRSLRNLGVPLLGWTIREKAEYEEAKGRFDNLIVDAVLFAMAGESPE
jgi:glycerophosphoryl diester phosphodiesterase